MRKSTVILFLLSLSVCACKTEHIDSEPVFAVSFHRDNKWKGKDFCFKNISNNVGKRINKTCIDSLNSTIDFPLNLNAKSCVFVFDAGNKKDTIQVGYNVQIGRGKDSFEAQVTGFKILYTTFHSFKINTREGNKPGTPNETNSINIYL